MFAKLQQAARGLLLALASSGAAWAVAPTVTVDTHSQSLASVKAFAIKITLKDPSDISLKIYDADGRFVRLLAAKHVPEQQLLVPWDLRDSDGKEVAPGAYSAVLASGLRLRLDKHFASDGVLADKAFKNPGVLRLDKEGNLYLLDIGTSTLFKFDSEGSPISEWKGKNTIIAPSPPCWAGLAVEPDGSSLYLSESLTTSHVVDVYDGRTAERLRYLGGFFGEDIDWLKEKGGIAYPMWLGLNGESKLYADSPGYARIWAFDRRKEGKPAGIWQLGGITNPRVTWHSPGDCGDTDGVNSIYLASYETHKRAELFKLIDLGDTVQFVYDLTSFTDPRTKLNTELGDIYGVAYDGERGLWVVERSPPRILKIADRGTGFDFVAAFGSKGKNAAKLEFLAPRGAAVSPDGKFLYLVEDGDAISKSDSTKGQARVARYKIDYADRKTVKLTVRP